MLLITFSQIKVNIIFIRYINSHDLLSTYAERLLGNVVFLTNVNSFLYFADFHQWKDLDNFCPLQLIFIVYSYQTIAGQKSQRQQNQNNRYSSNEFECRSQYGIPGDTFYRLLIQ